MSRKFFYISPDFSFWKLTFDKKVLFRDANKQQVITVGRHTARANAPSELVIQNSNGTIVERETYGNDPFPPRG